VKRDTWIAGAAFIAVPAAILLYTVICTWFIARGAEWLRVPFRALCHGLPARSFALFGTTMPLCARCVAIYGGLIAGFLTFLAMPWLREKVMRVVAVMATMPLAIDGITQASGLRESTNTLRLATGITAAFACALWAMSAVEHREPQSFTAS
jgi:uncharacterized membrane protein